MDGAAREPTGEQAGAEQAGPRPPWQTSGLDPRALLGLIHGAVHAGHPAQDAGQAGTLAVADECWRLLAEVTRRLEDEPDPEASLGEICGRLAVGTGLGVATVLAEAETVSRVVARPPGTPWATWIATLEGRVLEAESVLGAALRGSDTVHFPAPLPRNAAALASQVPEGIGSVTVVPLRARGTTLGAIFLHRPDSRAIDARVLGVAEQVAGRLALTLLHGRLKGALSQLEGAHEAARMREELLAALSHDMQTPLAVLLGSIRALQAVDDLAPKHRAGLYESMARRGAQLHRLVEQFLDYSRLEAGHPIEVRPALTDVGAAIARIETDVGWRRPLQLAVPEDLPPAFVDPDRLDQVLTNLVSNAVKYSPVGSAVSVLAHATDHTVEVAVVDRGPGIERSELENVFGKFTRGAGTKGTPGTGLGLYVSRAVIEAQGGELRAESSPGKGSRFTVVLPRHSPLV